MNTIANIFEPTRCAQALKTLTSRQREILSLAAEGLLQKEIGDRLGIDLKTVGYHQSGAYRRLGVVNGVQATRVFLAGGGLEANR